MGGWLRNVRNNNFSCRAAPIPRHVSEVWLRHLNNSYLEDVLQLKVLLVQRFHGKDVSQRNITGRPLALRLGVAQRVRRESEVARLEAALPEESVPALRPFRHQTGGKKKGRENKYRVRQK